MVTAQMDEDQAKSIFALARAPASEQERAGRGQLRGRGLAAEGPAGGDQRGSGAAAVKKGFPFELRGRGPEAP